MGGFARISLASILIFFRGEGGPGGGGTPEQFRHELQLNGGCAASGQRKHPKCGPARTQNRFPFSFLLRFLWPSIYLRAHISEKTVSFVRENSHKSFYHRLELQHRSFTQRPPYHSRRPRDQRQSPTKNSRVAPFRPRRTGTDSTRSIIGC